MSKTYTTGEMAKLCNVSVRTVQFYDTKGLLPPTDLTEGGRRLYTDDDLIKLRLICMLKSFDISLSSIQGILRSKTPVKVLSLLLDEQQKRLNDDINDKQEQVAAIKIVKESIQSEKQWYDKEAIPVNSIGDIEHIMENKKGLKRVHFKMLAMVLPTTLIWWSTILIWILRGLWIPFTIYTPIHLILCFLVVLFLNRKTQYICPECNVVFRPPYWKFAFTSGNKTRLLSCPNGHKGYCVEVYANDR